LTCAFSPPFTGYLKAFAEAAWDRGWRNAAMVVTLGAYGDEWRQEFRKDWEARGGKILADKPANYYTETDFSSQLSAALAAHPDFLLIGGPSEPTGLVIEQARNLGFDGGFILVDQAKMDYIADVVFKGDLSLMNHTFGVARVLDAPSLVIEDFDKRYHQKFGIPNTYEALLNYSALRAVCSAMEAAGTVNNPTAIKAAFPKVLPQSTSEAPTPFLGIKGKRFYVAGSVGFVENGQFAKTHHYVWWAQNRSEFKQAVKNLPEGRVIRNIQLQGYNL
jgi:branched-chain amino acid transport system substrate-binding protein